MNLVKYLSFRKIRLLVLLKLSYHISYLLKRNIRWGRYIALSIEPTNRCNLSCIECPTGTQSLERAKGEFSLEAYRRLLKEKYKDLLYLNFYFQGEPFLNKDITEMIRMASERSVYTSISTNAQLIDEAESERIIQSGLNRIVISIDGVTQDVYEKYRRGGRLDFVIEATRNILKAKERLKSCTPKVVFQFLVFKHNEHQINAIKQLGREMGVDTVEIKTAQIYNYKNNTELITSIDRYSRYKQDEKGEYHIKNSMPNKCWRMWHSLVITQDLDVVPCCYDKNAFYKLGNINDKSISKVESGIKYKTFRQNIINERSCIDICKNCDENR